MRNKTDTTERVAHTGIANSVDWFSSQFHDDCTMFMAESPIDAARTVLGYRKETGADTKAIRVLVNDCLVRQTGHGVFIPVEPTTKYAVRNGKIRRLD